MLPGQSEEVEAGRLGHAAAGVRPGRVVEDRQRRSTSGRGESRWPRSRCARPARLPSLKRDRRARRHRPLADAARTPWRLRRVRGLEPISVSRASQPAADPRVRSTCGSVPVFSRYQNRSRPRIRCGSGVCARSDRQMDLVRGGQLLGDLKAGVAATDDQHRTIGKVLGERYWVLWNCTTSGPRSLSDRWHERDLERAGGDHDLIGRVSPVVELDPVPAPRPAGSTGRGCPARPARRSGRA